MAMELLNHVKKDVIGQLIGKYENFAQDIQDALAENKKALGKLHKATQQALSESGETIKGAAVTANKAVKKNPWAFVAGATACALAIGYIVGKKR